MKYSWLTRCDLGLFLMNRLGRPTSPRRAAERRQQTTPSRTVFALTASPSLQGNPAMTELFSFLSSYSFGSVLASGDPDNCG